jgi:SPOR domain
MARGRGVATPAQIRVTLRSVTDGSVYTVLIRSPAYAPVSVAVGRFVAALQARGVDGVEGLEFDLFCERLGRVLAEDQTLVSEGVSDGDALSLIPRDGAANDTSTGDGAGSNDPGPAGPPTPDGDAGQAHDGGQASASERRAQHWSADQLRASMPDRQSSQRRRRIRRALVVLSLVVVGGGAILVGVLPTREADDTQAPRLAAQFEAGHWVQLASFREARAAMRAAGRARAHAIPATTLSSDGVEELYPDWYVVAVGPLRSAAAQRRLIRRARRAGFTGAITRTYTPVSRAATPAQLAGVYRGTLTHVGPHGHTRGSRVVVRLALSAAGHGTVHYERPSCTGDLQASRSARAVLVWREHVVSGRCTSDGRWITRRSSDRLVVTWRQSGRRAWRAGRLVPAS